MGRKSQAAKETDNAMSFWTCLDPSRKKETIYLSNTRLQMNILVNDGEIQLNISYSEYSLLSFGAVENSCRSCADEENHFWMKSYIWFRK